MADSTHSAMKMTAETPVAGAVASYPLLCNAALMVCILSYQRDIPILAILLVGAKAGFSTSTAKTSPHMRQAADATKVDGTLETHSHSILATETSDSHFGQEA